MNKYAHNTDWTMTMKMARYHDQKIRFRMQRLMQFASSSRLYNLHPVHIMNGWFLFKDYIPWYIYAIQYIYAIAIYDYFIHVVTVDEVEPLFLARLAWLFKFWQTRLLFMKCVCKAQGCNSCGLCFFWKVKVSMRRNNYEQQMQNCAKAWVEDVLLQLFPPPHTRESSWKWMY